MFKKKTYEIIEMLKKCVKKNVSEEIFGSTQAMSFSDGGTKLAYITFDDTSVPSTCLQEYGTPNTMYDQHSSVFRYHYPKVYIYIYYTV